jgi:hypothetical protein
MIFAICKSIQNKVKATHGLALSTFLSCFLHGLPYRLTVAPHLTHCTLFIPILRKNEAALEGTTSPHFQQGRSEGMLNASQISILQLSSAYGLE